MHCKLERRHDQGQAGLISGHTGKSLSLADGVGELFSGFFVEPWFMVKQIDLGGTAGLKKINYPLGFGRVMGSNGMSPLGLKHGGKSQRAQTPAEAIKGFAAGKVGNQIGFVDTHASGFI